MPWRQINDFLQKENRKKWISGQTRTIYYLAVMKPFTSIPGPKVYPLIGSLGSYMFGPYNRLKYHEALADMHRQFGPIVKEQIGPEKEVVHVFDPEDIKTVS